MIGGNVSAAAAFSRRPDRILDCGIGCWVPRSARFGINADWYSLVVELAVVRRGSVVY